MDKIDRGETLVDVGAYCLMPNHFHLLIKEKVENGISEFMKKFLLDILCISIKDMKEREVF